MTCWFGGGLMVAAVLYPVVAGWLLFRAAETLLRVAAIGTIPAGGAPPDGSSEPGYRGDPAAAFGAFPGQVPIPRVTP